MLQCVRVQGNCGSCFINTGIEQIESDAMRLLSKTYVLSRQQVIDCGNVGGCNGGTYADVWDYVKTVGGVMLESDYPYTSGRNGTSGSCRFDAQRRKITVRDYVIIGGYLNNEASVAAYVQSVGPVSVAVNADPLQSYVGGIMTACNQLEVNHVLQAVGVLPNSVGGYWYVIP